MIDLDEFAGPLGPLFPGQAPGVAVGAPRLLVLCAAAAEGAGPDVTEAHTLGEDPADGGLAQINSLA